MWRLMQKFSGMFLFYFGVYFGILLPLVNSDRLTGPDPLDPSFVIYLTTYLFWLCLGSIWSQEQLEFKSRGYGFLQTLPIRAQEIVGAKFLLVFLSVLTFLVIHLAWFSLTFDDPVFLATARSNLILTTGLCLLLGGFYYLGFFRFGFARFSKYAFSIWIGLLIAPLPVRILLKERFGIGSREITQAVLKVNPYVVFVLCLFIFIGCFFIAVRLKKTFFQGKLI